MLGLRRYQGVQVDLWQGELERFVHDQSLVFEAQGELDLTHGPGLHVVLLPQPAVNWDATLALDFMKRLKRGLDEAHAKPRRLTLVMPDLGRYKIFQAALFSSFPDV